MLSPAAMAEPTVLAVMYFDAHSVRPELEPLGRGLTDMLITDLAGATGVSVVERSRLNVVLEELELQRSGFVDPETAVRVGEGLGASEVVMGSITVAMEGMRLDARLVRVADGTVIDGVSASGPESAFFDLERQLAEKLLARLGATASLPERQLTLEQAIDASKRIDEADSAYLNRLVGVRKYTERRWRRDGLSVTLGGGEQALTTVKTWAFYDGGGAMMPPRLAADFVGDEEVLVRLDRIKNDTRIAGWTGVAAGVVLASVGAVVVSSSGNAWDYEYQSSPFKRSKRKQALGWALAGGGSTLAVGTAYVALGVSNKRKWAANFWDAEAADRLVEQANSRIADEVGISERDRREADIRE